MKLILPYIIILAFAFLSSCDHDNSIMNPTNGDFIVPVIVPEGDEEYLNLDSDYIFDQEKLHTFELKIPQSSLNRINADPVAEEYVEGMLIFQGDTISPVGIRYKGSVGAFVGCVSGDDWANPSGHKTCTKLSLKVKINWEGREEHFYKLKKLQFHSQNLDDSQMHERLGYWLFRSMGVPAPRSVHAKVIVNGKYSGLYVLTEQIDGRFTRYHFEDGEGNLYKEVWPLNRNGFSQTDNTFINALKTNEDDNPSVDLIKSFAQQLSGSNASVIQNIVAEWMDVNEIISFIVVDRMIRNDDGPFHWYCSGSGCSNHNYYWYEEPNNRKLHLIPWDLDNAFENILHNANPVTPIADDWGEITNNCKPFPYGILGIKQWSASCDKLTAAWATYSNEFEQTKSQFINGPFSEVHVNTQLDTWTQQIREATVEARNVNDDAVSKLVWENAVKNLKNQLQFSRNN